MSAPRDLTLNIVEHRSCESPRASEAVMIYLERSDFSPDKVDKLNQILFSWAPGVGIRSCASGRI